MSCVCVCLVLTTRLGTDATHTDSASPETPSPVPDHRQHAPRDNQKACTGGQDDEEDVATLKVEIERLKAMNQRLQAEVDQFRAASAAEPAEATADDEEVGADALRKRLSRLCERKKNGFLGFMLTCMVATSCYCLGKLGVHGKLRQLLVPEEVHQAWLKGDRAELGRKLRECGLDKDCSCHSLRYWTVYYVNFVLMRRSLSRP